jgi:hypothetical protein
MLKNGKSEQYMDRSHYYPKYPTINERPEQKPGFLISETGFLLEIIS